MPKRKPSKRAATKSKPVKRSPGGKQTAPAKAKSADEKSRDYRSVRQQLYDTLCDRIAKGQVYKAADIKQVRLLGAEINKEDVPSETPSDLVETGKEAAIYCGTSQRVITDHVQKGKLKRHKDGSFDKSELNKWLERYGKKETGDDGKSDTLKTQIDKAELRYRLAKARKEERLADEAEGIVVKWADVEAQWGERIRVVTSSLDKLPDRLPAILVGRTREEMHEILKDEIREFRASFRRKGQYCPECKRTKGKRNGANA